MTEEKKDDECCGSGCCGQENKQEKQESEGGCCGSGCCEEELTEEEIQELEKLKEQMEKEGGCCGGGCCGGEKEEEEEEEEEENEEESGEDQKDEMELFQVSQKAVIYNPENKKYLLVQCKEENPKMPALWAFIGGRIKKGENAIESLERKIHKEAGDIEYEIGEVVSADADGRCRVGYLVKYKGGEVILSKEHSNYVWKTFSEVQSEKEFHQKLKKLIKAAEEKLRSEEYLAGWKMCQADFENYKKSQLNLGQDFAARAVEDVITRSLPVLDNFHASTDHIPEDQKDGPWVQGIMHIQKQLEDVLKETGVEEVKVSVGDKFDPAQHEAIEDAERGSQNADRENKRNDGKIKKIVQKGYLYGGKVIRPARVIVE